MKLPVPIKKKLDEIKRVCESYLANFNAGVGSSRIAQLEAMASSKEFWKNSDEAEKLSRELSSLRKQKEELLTLEQTAKELQMLADLAWQEEDIQTQSEVQTRITQLEEKIAWRKFEARFDQPYDKNDCSIEIHAGAGGTESQDWVQMLLRLYSRWAEKHGFTTEVVSTIYGEEAGIKSFVMKLCGAYAYGWLRGEEGVHRLVRISPFDAENRRHTSFASVCVYPVLEQEKINVSTSDLRIDTFRASGAGGQHVNRTDSAVRITHLPTGVVAQCQNNRSQHQNKAAALELLREKLWKAAHEKQAQEKKLAHLQKDAIGWGHQIRSYVMQPYQLVKDLRTNLEMGNVQAVLDGEIDSFLTAYLDAQTTCGEKSKK